MTAYAGVLMAAFLAPAADPPSEIELLKQFRAEFVQIAPGKSQLAENAGELPASFDMGGEDAGPVHRVKIGQAFSIAKYEVTQELFQAVMGANPSKWKGPRNSVEMVSFDDAVEFCQKATTKLRELKFIAADEVVRLPSEAEWEYAARAGTQSRFSFGDDVNLLGDFGWFTGNAKGNDPPVGAKKPNALGLYDVHGYLWEWCADPWHADYTGAPVDGSAWKMGDDAERVLRGGSWKDAAEKLTSTARRAGARDLLDDAVGLRCVLARQP